MEGSYPGFGYPLYELSVPTPSEASFSSQRSWASPFRAFLLSGDRMDRSQPILPFRRFPTKPLGLVPTLQRIPPTEKAAPLVATQRFSPGQGLLLSWDFRASQALSPGKPAQRSSPSPGSPLSLRSKRPLNLFSREPQGLRSFLARLLPRKGAGLLDLPDPRSIHLFESGLVAAYFFSSKAPNPLRSPDHSLFATNPKSS
jgi:hypothetical protein